MIGSRRHVRRMTRAADSRADPVMDVFVCGDVKPWKVQRGWVTACAPTPESGGPCLWASAGICVFVSTA